MLLYMLEVSKKKNLLKTKNCTNSNFYNKCIILILVNYNINGKDDK